MAECFFAVSELVENNVPEGLVAAPYVYGGGVDGFPNGGAFSDDAVISSIDPEKCLIFPVDSEYCASVWCMQSGDGGQLTVARDGVNLTVSSTTQKASNLFKQLIVSHIDGSGNKGVNAVLFEGRLIPGHKKKALGCYGLISFFKSLTVESSSTGNDLWSLNMMSQEAMQYISMTKTNDNGWIESSGAPVPLGLTSIKNKL